MPRAKKFGDDIDTDLIIAARYLNTSDEKELCKHIFEDMNLEKDKEVLSGDIIVAGDNFGCGSSREHAPLALKAAGVKAVLAKSFARIFYRNSFNIGFPIYELNECNEINANDELEIDETNALIINKTSNKSYKFTPIPPFMQELVDAGGLIEYAKKKAQ